MKIGASAQRPQSHLHAMETQIKRSETIQYRMDE